MKQIVNAILLISMISLCGCKKDSQGEQVRNYRLQEIEHTDKVLQNFYSATVRGKQDVDIYPQVSGTVSTVSIKEGQRVKKGETLFIIDQVPFKAALKVAEANTETAKANLATSELVYKSKQELFNENVISQFELSTAKNNLMTAKAQLSQAEAQELNARNNLSYTVVKSPANGVAGVLPYREGALVSPSLPQPLTTISDNSEMVVYFSMTENQLLGLTRKFGSKENALKNMPPIHLKLNDGSIYEANGKIESISGVIDQSTGTVSVRAVFPNANEFLTSGGAGNVIIPETYSHCIVIPQSATFELQDKIFVYKVVDGKAKSTQVEVQRVNGGQEYIIKEGLKEHDRIVVEGVGLLREGTQVTTKQ